MEDKIMRFLAYDGKISVVCTNTTNLVEIEENTKQNTTFLAYTSNFYLSKVDVLLSASGT